MKALSNVFMEQPLPGDVPPDAEPGEIHEFEKERDEQESIEIPGEAGQKEEDEPEDGGKLSHG
jgi:hypothetical protein